MNLARSSKKYEYQFDSSFRTALTLKSVFKDYPNANIMLTGVVEADSAMLAIKTAFEEHNIRLTRMPVGKKTGSGPCLARSRAV